MVRENYYQVYILLGLQARKACEVCKSTRYSSI